MNLHPPEAFALLWSTRAAIQLPLLVGGLMEGLMEGGAMASPMGCSGGGETQRQFRISDHSAAKEVRVALHCTQPGQVRAAPPLGLLAQALLQCSNFSLRFRKGLSLISIEVCGFVLLIRGCCCESRLLESR